MGRRRRRARCWVATRDPRLRLLPLLRCIGTCTSTSTTTITTLRTTRTSPEGWTVVGEEEAVRRRPRTPRRPEIDAWSWSCWTSVCVRARGLTGYCALEVGFEGGQIKSSKRMIFVELYLFLCKIFSF
uniref:(northern house mosquito) hypothetical protein n=1 Tax=Culex pipiens TaxID=7175 RepID=A0A8D8MXU8_CULPI